MSFPLGLSLIPPGIKDPVHVVLALEKLEDGRGCMGWAGEFDDGIPSHLFHADCCFLSRGFGIFVCTGDQPRTFYQWNFLLEYSFRFRVMSNLV